jgi:hypothetical protein
MSTTREESVMEQLDALRERHLRLRRVAQRVVDEAVAAGDRGNPMCAVAPHVIRILRRELDGEPQPSAFATMSVS